MENPSGAAARANLATLRPSMHSQTETRRCRLALEDGTVFQGRPFGLCTDGATVGGEVVFNTAMCGYQEAITDPSYTGQILTMTAPEMGNYGVATEDGESRSTAVAGFVVREAILEPSNHRAVAGLSEWLAKSGVIGIEGIDTRALVRILRVKGALRGILFVGTA